MRTHVISEMHAIAKLYDREMGKAAQKTGLSRLEADILTFLKNNPGMDIASDIVEYRMLSKANVSQGVESLIQKGYLSRDTDPVDRRRVHLRIAQKADQCLPCLIHAQESFAQALAMDFTPEEREKFAQMVAKIAKNARNKLEGI